MTVVSDNDVGARACVAEESLFGGSIEKPTLALVMELFRNHRKWLKRLHKTVGQQVRSR